MHNLLNKPIIQLSMVLNLSFWTTTKHLLLKFMIPSQFINKSLLLNFKIINFFHKSKNDKLYLGTINQQNHVALINMALGRLEFATQDQLTNTYTIHKKFTLLLSACNQFKLCCCGKEENNGILGLSYQGQDKEHITKC